MATFTGPVDRIPFAPPFDMFKFERGRTVYRLNGAWHEDAEPEWATIAAADLVAAASRPGGERTDGTDRDRYLFLGGHTYTVSSTVATDLTNAGYGSYLS